MLVFIAYHQLSLGSHGRGGETPWKSEADASVSSAITKFNGSGAAKTNGLVPQDRLVATVMEFTTSPRHAEIISRMKAAMQQDPDWAMGYIRTHSESGQPLPYNSKFGVSESEYQEILSSVSQVKYQAISEAELCFAPTKYGTFVIDGGRDLPELTGIEVDLTNDRIITQYGVLDEKDFIDAPDTTALGAWQGIQWKKVQLTRASCLSTDFTIGRLRQSGQWLLLYDVKEFDADGTRVRINRVLTFDAKAAKNTLCQCLETLLR